MKREVREVFHVLTEQYPKLRTSVRFTFWVRLSNRTSKDEIWEINLWRSVYRKSRVSKPKVEIAIPRSHFWALVEHSSRRLWRNAFDNGYVLFEGNKTKSQRLRKHFTSITR